MNTPTQIPRPSCLFACLFLVAAFLAAPTIALAAPYQMENLGRGVIAMRTGTNSVYVGWRQLGLDPSSISYNVYRGSTKVNASPITNSTNLVDTGATLSVANTYTVCPVIGGIEQPPSAGYTLPANAPTQQYLRVPLQQPAGGTTPDSVAYTYTPNDCSLGDLDGDGEYEIVVKWDPTNAKDNSQSGYTGNVYLDGYKLDGTRLWRIDLGRNIRAGAHYTQFMVYDLDGDGKAEVACKTADATISGTGQVIGNGSADHRNASGYILAGPEFLTVFNGQTGAILATANYVVPRGTVGNWGDTYGNRVDRFLAAVAYLDGTRPSLVMCRGYYTRTVLAAWDWRNGQLTQRWTFDTGDSTTGPLAGYRGQGAHSLSVADVDADGKQEIVYGACVIDDNGTGKYTTLKGHGDALHVSDMNPSRAGLEVYMIHESPSAYGTTGSELHDANTGSILVGVSGENADVGRGAAGDINPNYAGYEMWASRGGMYNVGGTLITANKPSINFLVYWDADLLRELLDNVTISKWNSTTHAASAILAPTGVASNNSTKATPNLSADIFGDWREEVVWRETGNTALRIYTTTDVTTNRLYTLMHDPQYRVAIAWQNVAYNQPPHPGFFLGDAMAAAPTPPITYVGGGGGGNVAPSVSITAPANGATFTAGANITINANATDSDGTVTGVEFFQGSTSLGTAAASPYSVTWNNVPAGTHSLTARATDNASAQTTSSPISITVNAAGGADTYQAESAAIAGGVTIDSNNAGFNGTGFANFPATGGTLTFNNVDGNGGGTKVLSIRYALGATAARTGNITVNGSTTTITFQPTGAWTTWNTMTVSKTLNNNTSNTIQFASTGNDLGNIDEITVP